MNHKTAPLEIRERLQLSCGEVDRTLPELMRMTEIREAICLSTCNRVEVISRVTDSEQAVAGLKSSYTVRGISTLPRWSDACTSTVIWRRSAISSA